MRALSKTLAAVLLCGAASLAQAADTAICYNCPPDWADWGTQLKAIAASTGVQVPLDNKNSGQSLAQLVAEKAAPVADVVYYGVTFGLQAQKAEVVGTYKPKGFEQIPAGLKDPAGHWFAIHSGTLGIMVNVDALGGLPVPQGWADLLKPEYKGMVGYLDPSSAFVGYVSAVAITRDLAADLTLMPKLQHLDPEGLHVMADLIVKSVFAQCTDGLAHGQAAAILLAGQEEELRSVGRDHIEEDPHGGIDNAAHHEFVVAHQTDRGAEGLAHFTHQHKAKLVHVGKVAIETGGHDAGRLRHFAQAQAWPCAGE